jgi:hypothetical protein
MIRALFICVLLTTPAWATTYYVSFTNGLDSHTATQAQSKTTPWKNAPGMQTCASACASTTINAGDSIILEGGDTWPNASFEWALPSNGTSGSPIYVGVDKTWYIGGSWTRPILTAGSSLITNNNNVMIAMVNYTTFDNFEITGFYWTLASCSGPVNCTIINMGQDTGQTVENLYVHGWTHAGTNSSSNNGVATGILTGASGGTSVAHDIVIVGTDVSGDHSLTAFYGGPPTVYNTYCKQVASCFITGSQALVHDNYIADIGPAYCNTPTITGCTHENGFEDNGDQGLLFYNNVITNVNAGLAIWIAPNPTYTASVFNNVIYGVHDNQVLDFAPPVYISALCPQGATGNNYCLAAGNYIVENNTVQCGDDSTQYDGCQSGVGIIGSGSIANSFVYQNNHFITATTASGCYSGTGHATSCTFAASNVVQTQTTANGQGYTSSQTFAFYPTSGGSTIGAGTNLTGSWPIGSTNDTTYACTDASNIATCPARTQNPRPASGVWDSGSYNYLTNVNAGGSFFGFGQ